MIPFAFFPRWTSWPFLRRPLRAGPDTVGLPSRELLQLGDARAIRSLKASEAFVDLGSPRRPSGACLGGGCPGGRFRHVGSFPVSGSWEPWHPHPISPAGDAGRGGRIERHLYGRAPPLHARSSAPRSPGGSRSIGTTETQWRGNLMNDERPQMHMALLRHNRPACHWHGRAQRKWPNSMWSSLLRPEPCRRWITPHAAHHRFRRRSLTEQERPKVVSAARPRSPRSTNCS